MVLDESLYSYLFDIPYHLVGDFPGQDITYSQLELVSAPQSKQCNITILLLQ